MGRWGKVLLACSCAIVVIPTFATDEGEVLLSWRSSAGAQGYEIHWGRSESGVYTSSADVGDSTEYHLTGMSDCTEYWIAARAYSRNGTDEVNFSDFSDEVACWPRPRLDSVTCEGGTSFGPNTATTCTVTGFNFRAGAELVWNTVSEGPPAGVTTSNMRVSTPCHEITFDLEVGGASALSGASELQLRVRNPSQVTSEPAGTLVVGEPPAAPTLIGVD